jgi:DNA-directed RNA polymerase subunit RPC12/RpoP
MRKAIVLGALCAALLTACEIEDDLEIRADGTGTYRARIAVERVIRPVLEQIRADAESQGFRIIDEGATFSSRYIVVRKDFDEIRALNGPRGNFDLNVEDRLFRRRYRLRASLGAFPEVTFDRRFTITMPAKIVSASDGAFEGRRLTWYCSGGGTLDVVAESFRVPVGPILFAAAAALSAVVLLVVLVRRPLSGRALARAAARDRIDCTTCRRTIAADARYCPACGDRVLVSHRPSGSP